MMKNLVQLVWLTHYTNSFEIPEPETYSFLRVPDHSLIRRHRDIIKVSLLSQKFFQHLAGRPINPTEIRCCSKWYIHNVKCTR